MSRMDLETAIRLSAEVKGGANITKVQRSLQDLAKGGQTTAREMGALRMATLEFAKTNDKTITGIRSSIIALRGMQEQAKIGGVQFRQYGSEIQRLEAKLKGLDGTAKAAGRSLALREAAASAGGSMIMGGGMQASLGAAAGSLAAAGTAAGMALAAGVAAGGALAAVSVTNALDEAASTRRVRTLTDDADNLMAKIRELTVEQGNLSNSTEAGAAAYEILSSGFSKTADVLAILKASTYGATGGFSDIKTVADGATSIMNSFGLGADKVTRVVDQMVQTQNDGKIVVDQYARSVGRLAPTFAVAGLSVEEMNAAISALTAKGAPVESTMSGLNQTVKSIIKPTEEAKAVAAALGLEFSAAALQAKGLGGFLQDVTDKTKGNTTALGVLFSDIDGFKAVAALTNDGLKAYNKSLANMERATGTAATAAKLAVDPVKQFDNAWKGLSATLGQSVLPTLTLVVKGLTSVINKARQVDWGQIAGDLPGLLDPSGPSLQVRPSVRGSAAFKPPAAGDWNNMAWPEGIPRPGTAPPQPRMRAPRGPENTAITALVNEAAGGGTAKAKPANAAQLIEHLHGDPNRRGYDRAGHGTQSNAHDHFGFSSEAATRYVMKELQAAGITTTRFGVKSGHSRNSMHYRNQAFDVPWAQFGSGPIGERDFKQSRRVEALVKDALARFNGGTAGGDGGENMREMARQEEMNRQQQAKAREDGLRSSGRSAAIARLNLDLSKATTEEAKLQAAFDRERAERMYRFSGQLAEAKSTEEQINLMKQQGLEATQAQVDLDQKLVALAKDRVVELAKQQEAAMRPMLDSIEQKQAQLGGAGAVRALERRNAVGSMAAAGVDPAKAGALFDEIKALDERISKQQELNDLVNEGGQAMQGFLDSMIRGTESWQESLAGLVESLGKVLLQAGLSALAGKDGVGLFSILAGSFGKSFAGGGYTGSSPRAGGIDGQGGFPAILHPKETVIDHTRMMPVPYQSSPAAAATGEPVVPYQGASAAAATGGLTVPYQSSGTTLAVPFLKGGGGGDGAASMPLNNEPIRYESTVINGVEYVTKAEAEEIGKRSEQRTFKKLQNSPGARRAVGIR